VSGHQRSRTIAPGAFRSLFSSEVILADLDLAFGTANLNFDNDPTQGIAEAVFSPDRLDEVFLDRLLAKCSEHLSMLAAPSMLDRTYDFSGDAFLADPRDRSAQCSGLGT
jgi:pilus assembly protein CpaE